MTIAGATDRPVAPLTRDLVGAVPVAALRAAAAAQRSRAREPARLRPATLSALGVWRSLVARSVRVGEAPSSNLGTPIFPAECGIRECGFRMLVDAGRTSRFPQTPSTGPLRGR